MLISIKVDSTVSGEDIDAGDEFDSIIDYFKGLEQSNSVPKPSMRIKSITDEGLVTIYINEPLETPPWPLMR